jgi:hypothetical protein
VYYGLSSAITPTPEELLAAWSAWGDDLDAWQAGHGKPVIFGEIGYRSLDQAAYRPWYWADLSCRPEDYNGLGQANAYAAAFEFLSTKPW